MPRFRDEWLTDRVLFDYVSGGQCACCGFAHMFLPNGTADLITAMSDLETDQAQQEIKNLAESPWPAPLRDQVWADRVRLRQKLKLGMKGHLEFWQTHEIDFTQWCESRPVSFWRRIFQLPRTEIMEWLRNTYNIHSAFGVVLCAVVEQVAFFELTSYPPDGRGCAELEFERALKFSRQAGFTISNLESTDGQDTLRSDVLEMWLDRMKSLRGPKLLERGSRSTNYTTRNDEGSSSGDDGNSSEGGADDPDEKETQAGGAGFASDRRIIRLLIARYWADIVQKKYLDFLKEENDVDKAR